jgi:hypothetical protein
MGRSGTYKRNTQDDDFDFDFDLPVSKLVSYLVSNSQFILSNLRLPQT